MKPLQLFTCLACITVFAARAAHAETWIPLFNGKNLDGWTPKFTGHPLGENPNNIFRVEDGLLKVCYEDTDTFRGDFGHLFYQTPFSHYRIRAVFRFTGEPLPNGPGFGFRNNGLMLHSQDPITMRLDQNFPDSIEVQFRGNKFVDGQPQTDYTMAAHFNPGTTARVHGENVVQAQTLSPVFEGSDWVTVEVEVRGQDEMVHYVNGKEVLRATDFRLDRGTPIGSGFIAIQAESHPTEFQSIELLPMAPPEPATKRGAENQAPEGYTALFDGKTLNGWKVHPKSVGHWKVLEGVIDYDALSEAPKEERHLWSEQSFSDFELHMDWRIKER